MVKKIFVLMLLLISLAVNTALSAVRYEADMAHSNVGFSVPILGGLSQVKGKFTDFKVAIDYDEADITKSSVTATIKAASIDTGIERRDTHLRTADFFDVEKFPEITFQSKRVEKKGENKFVATGAFTMHGVTKEISIPFTITGKSTNPTTKRSTIGFNATLTIDRRDYGITYQNKTMPTFLGDQVAIELNVKADTPAPPEQK